MSTLDLGSLTLALGNDLPTQVAAGFAAAFFAGGLLGLLPAVFFSAIYISLLHVCLSFSTFYRPALLVPLRRDV